MIFHVAGGIVTRDEAHTFAAHWITAWNTHDLDGILAHYDDSVELTSPLAAKLLSIPDGKVSGKSTCRPISSADCKLTRTFIFSWKMCSGV
jgi:hypothetical protein